MIDLLTCRNSITCLALNSWPGHGRGEGGATNAQPESPSLKEETGLFQKSPSMRKKPPVDPRRAQVGAEVTTLAPGQPQTGGGEGGEGRGVAGNTEYGFYL